MVEIFLAAKVWDSEVIGKFYKALQNLPDKEKCDCTIFIAQTLQKREEHINFYAAAEILEYGIANYKDVSDETKAKMHWALGHVLEHNFLNYEAAYKEYAAWKELDSQISGAYAALTRCLLLRDNFVYSEELEEYLIKSHGEGGLGSREERLYESIAWYLVFSHKGNQKKMSEHREHAQTILKADENFLYDYLFKTDAPKDKLNIPQNVKIFVKEMN